MTRGADARGFPARPVDGRDCALHLGVGFPGTDPRRERSSGCVISVRRNSSRPGFEQVLGGGQIAVGVPGVNHSDAPDLMIGSGREPEDCRRESDTRQAREERDDTDPPVEGSVPSGAVAGGVEHPLSIGDDQLSLNRWARSARAASVPDWGSIAPPSTTIVWPVM